MSAEHRPPPESTVRALTRAGLSRSTAVAMECWKAQEVLELLGIDQQARGSTVFREAAPARGTI